MFLQLRFWHHVTKLLVRIEGLVRQDRLHFHTDKNVDDVFNIIRKPGDKNTDVMLNRGQQDAVIAQKNLKLASFLFHHRCRCTFDWEVTRVHEDIADFLEGQKRLKYNYKDLVVLPKVNKADMVRMIEAIKECL